MAGNDSETGRLEAFSDGVLAIAITLLVLEIHAPEVGEEGLGRALAAQWREFVAYAVTFVIIGIMWANHHGLFRLVQRSDQGLMLANTLLLAVIAFLPFPTGVLAEHWNDSAALLLYGGTLTLIAVFYNLVWHYARLRRLLVPGLPPALVRRVNLGYLAGPLAYGAAMLLAPLHPGVSLAVWTGLALFFLLLPYE